MAPVGAVAGVDIGSTATKVVLLDAGDVGGGEGATIPLWSGVAATGAYARKTAAELLSAGLAASGATGEDLLWVVSTGYGRRLLPFSDEAVSEITANAKGALHLAGGAGLVRTVIDVGGQDSKAISLDEQGRMLDFAMNDKCAAGTGRFLEVLARALETELGDLGRVSLESTERLDINSTCTVFAESEVVGLLAQSRAVADIAAAVHRSIARRVAALASQLRGVGVVAPVLFDGGPALNAGLVAALSDELGVEVDTPERPQLATALGAARRALEAVSEEQRRSGPPVSGS